MKPRVAVIVGPTASGKTDTAIAFAKRINGEIISADSMQIYQYMDIGTAKPTAEEMQGIRHYLIDCIDPNQEYSVAQFKTDALDAIEKILKKHKIPVVVGGTGLYINGLTMPWGFNEKDTDPAVREKLEKECEKIGKEAFYQKLQKIDPQACEKIHYNNVKRVIRAMEIYEVTGKTKTQLDAEAFKAELPYEYVLMGIDMDRNRLYERINHRIDVMVQNGLIDEVRALLQRGLDQNAIAMKAIGYKEIFPYLEGKMSLEETLYVLKRDTRHFAKRQLTWFRKDKRIRWFEKEKYATNEEMAQAMVACFLKK